MLDFTTHHGFALLVNALHLSQAAASSMHASSSLEKPKRVTIN
jgi:hypothetical protein